MDKLILLKLLYPKLKLLLQKEHFPYFVEGKHYILNDGDWGGGFFVGILWNYYQHFLKENPEEAEMIKKHIVIWFEKLSPLRFKKTFDVGFMFYYSAVKGYEITGDEKFLPFIKDAVETLKTKFHKKARLIYHDYRLDSIRQTGSIIDTLPNTALLFWAYKHLDDREAGEIAYEHTENIIKHFIREDGSVYQAVWFDATSGSVFLKDNPQGAGKDSVWSRGQAWGILGFAKAWRLTGEDEFLKYAKFLSEYFVTNLNEDYTCPWDFRADDREILDNSASAIFLTATKIIGDFGEEREKIKQGLMKFINPSEKEGFLDGATFYKPKGRGVMAPCIWGDFYLIEGW